jgi:uncharacterized membrane protein YraQ (UPF0718 family)
LYFINIDKIINTYNILDFKFAIFVVFCILFITLLIALIFNIKANQTLIWSIPLGSILTFMCLKLMDYYGLIINFKTRPELVLNYSIRPGQKPNNINIELSDFKSNIINTEPELVLNNSIQPEQKPKPKTKTKPKTKLSGLTNFKSNII